MKRLKLFFACLLMAVLSIGQVWGGEPETLFSFTGSSNYSIPSGWSSQDVSTGNYLGFTADGSYLTSPLYDPHNSVSLSFTVACLNSGTNHPLTIYVLDKDDEVKETYTTGTPTGSSNYISTNSPWNIGDINYKFKIKFYLAAAGKGVRLRNTTLTGEAVSSCGNTVTITKGAETNGTYTLSATSVCGDGDGEDVTISEIEPAEGYEFDEITTSASGTVDNDLKKVTGITAATTITVKFKEKQKYTVSFNVGGSAATINPITEGTAGAGITLPAGPTPTCSNAGWTFAGWKETSAVAEQTTTAPTLFAAGTNYKPTDNCILYAVYKQEAGSSSGILDYTITFDDNGSDASSEISESAFMDYINTNASKVSSVPNIIKCYKGATGLKLSSKKNNGSFVLTLAESADITKVVLNTKKKSTTQGASYEVTVGSTNFSTSSTLSKDAFVDVEFTGTKTNSNSLSIASLSSTDEGSDSDGRVAWVKSITVYYEGTIVTYNYLSTPTCACSQLDAPTVTVPEGDLKYNSAKLTWTADLNAEKYIVKFNGEDHETYNPYYEATDLTAETEYAYQVKAIAVDGQSDWCDSEFSVEAVLTTKPAPTAHLTLIDLEGEHEATGDYTVGTPFNLPATAATCAKAFYGWTATENYSSENVAPEYKAGDEFTFLNTTGATLYAVYADAEGVEGSVEITPSTTGLPTGYGTANTFTECTLEGVKFQIQQMYKTGSGENLKMQWRAKGNGNGTGTMYNSDVLSNIQSVVLVYHADDTNKNFELTVGSSANPTSGTSITPSGSGTTYTYDCSGGSYNYFVLANGTNAGYLSQITINYFSSFNYSNYSTSCIAAPTAEPASNPLEVAAAAGNGTLNVTYKNVNLEGVTVALCDDNQGAAFTGNWLSASIAGDDKHIEYTVQANNSYNDARTAYIQLTAPETNNAATPAVVYIEVTQAKKAAVFGNLADLVAANVNTGTQVTVTFEEIITNDQFISQGSKRAGVMLTTTAGDQNKAIEIFYNKGTTVVPAEWVIGGKLAATSMTFTWTLFTGDQWELIPLGNDWTWDNGDLTYTAPKTVSSVVVSGAPSKTEYVDGEKFAPAGLTVTVNYNDNTSDVNPAGVTFACDPERVAKSETPVSVNVVATFNEVSSEAFPVNVTVGDIQLKTTQEFIAAGNADMRCYLEGIVSNITNTTYGNFDLTDASGKIYVYGCLNQAGEAQKFNELGVANGDKIKVIAEDYDYYNKHEAKNVVFVSKKSPATMTFDDLALEFGDVETMAPATITLADASDVIYSIKDGSDDCVTIADDQITAKSVAGTATIVATLAETDDYVGTTVEFTVTVTAPITKYAITFDGNGNTGGDAPEAIANQAENAEVTLPANTYTKDGYKFDGWKVINNTTSEEVSHTGNTFIMPASDVTLQATWEIISPWAYVYDNNVEVAHDGESGEDNGAITISETAYKLVKAGSGKKTGTIKVTVPAGATDLHFHAFAWGGTTAKIQISGVTNPSISEFDLAGEAGAAGTGNDFTLQGVPVDQYFHVSFDAVADETEIVFSKATGSADNRFFLYGVNQEGGNFGAYHRDVTNGNYGTICLPYAGTISGATLFEIANYENDMIYVDEILSGKMEAGRPYIFQATAGQLNVTYTSGIVVDEAGNANGLYGFYDLDDDEAKFNITEDAGNYILYQNAYWLVSGRAAYIANYRAYIKLNQINNTGNQAPGRRRVAMTVHGEQNATGMENAQGDNVQCTKVLIDGQLFILRGEKMYDATGKLVK